MKTDKRQTGRTTRMLEEAIRHAREGKAVYVVFETQAMVRCIKQMRMPEILGGEPIPHGIKFETPETLGNLDWRTMKLRNAHPNCVVLVDHHTIEGRFCSMLKMLERFNEANATVEGPAVAATPQTEKGN